MTARLFPDDPQFGHAPEELFVRTLRDQLSEDAVLFCNVRLSDRSQDREADVVVAWPGVGVAVVEVKGGSVSLQRGEWRQGGDGSDRVIHPVDRAVACKYLLCDYLAEHPRWSAGRPRTAHLVALPGHRAAARLHGSRSSPLDGDRHDGRPARRRSDQGRAGQGPRPAPSRRRPRTSRRSSTAWPAPPSRSSTCSPSSPSARPPATCSPGTRPRSSTCWRPSPRVEIRGGAGSGKTWLAVEKTRRLAAHGQRVTIMCYSRGLAEFLKRRVETLPKRQRAAYVGTFHNLGIGWGVAPGSDDDSRYWEEFLPTAMVSLAAELPVGERFDAIIIDEGQDFAQSWWDAVLAALRDPDTGSLSVFSDEGQRIFARQGRPTVDLMPIPLNENLRNTKQIAGTFSSLAPEQMRIRGSSGAPVRFVQCSTEDSVDAADDVADALLGDGWPPESVALLTTHRRHPVQVERQAEGQDAYWATYWQDDDVVYGHVLGFKGLERPAVVLAVNGFRDEARAKEMLYVALSRARDLLVVCGDMELIRRVGGEVVAQRLSHSPATVR